ncbi:HNH endonuclease [Roseinatronobacter alkalisoli]|uniref:HNH endonuclease signature motif containing protein n=1 Tax=Roseinatronobacter alkalisoli TaxID=3028235 RepID=A0ABT5TA87_9RHOB|nr:HNH endonuclease signature motif containing protein [Roseinatronobacter sp. HJB301]MDD7971901.1 HNH endonuclease signature motif containing protein [Roseinatronobacter sp. HJB301]
MGRRSFDTLGQVLFWSYANLAMADAAVRNGAEKYGVPYYMIRAKLYKALTDGTTSPRSLYFDERDKLLSRGRCSYCGSTDNPSLDHLFARVTGGADSAENLVFCCIRCNSSKGKQDALVWAKSKDRFLPLSVLRRYLKISIRYSNETGIIEAPRATFNELEVPFSISDIPHTYPKPKDLIWAY